MDPNTLKRLGECAPTPVAHLAARAQNELTAERQHHNSYYIFELWASLVACIAASRLRRREPTPRISTALASLAEPHLDNILELIQLQTELSAADEISQMWARPVLAHLLVGYRWLCKAANLATDEAPTVAALGRALSAYRKLYLGESGLREAAFYREAASILFDTVGGTVVDCSAALSGRLIAIEQVEVDESGHLSIIAFELVGSAQTRIPEPLSDAQLGRQAARGHVYFLEPHDVASALQPWVLWSDKQVLLIHRTSKSEIEYLNYTSGGTTRRNLSDQSRRALGLVQDALPTNFDSGRTGRWFGGYEVRYEIGRGGMGTVYCATQASLGLPVALKVLPSSFGDDSVALARFQREIAILKSCRHRNIVSILDAGQQEGDHYYAMEIVTGCSLAELYGTMRDLPEDKNQRITTADMMTVMVSILAKRPRTAGAPTHVTPALGFEGRRDGEEFWKLLLLRFAEIAEALGYLHAKGVVHRDVKPSNIMLCEDGSRAVLMDLGVAKQESGSVHTRTGTFVGTLRYASREQIVRSLDDLDFRTDLYSLGATMYEVLTLSPLYYSDESTASNAPDTGLLHKVLDERPAPACERNPALRAEVGVVLDKLLEKQADRRFYSSAEELAADLRAICEQRPIRARAYTEEERRAFALYDSLRSHAVTWESELRRDDLLWGEERVRELMRLDVAARFELSDLEKDFVIAATRHADALRLERQRRDQTERDLQARLEQGQLESEKQRLRVRRAAVMAVVLALSVLLSVSTVLLSRARRERDARARGELEARAARTQAEQVLARAYLIQGERAEREARWDEAALLYASALKLAERDPAAGSDGSRERAVQGVLREAALPIHTRLRWSKRMDVPAQSVAFSSDGKWVVLSGDEGVARLVSASNCADEAVLRPDHERKVTSSAVASDGTIALGLETGEVELWDVNKRELKRTFTEAASKVTALDFSPTGQLLAVGNAAGVLLVLDRWSGANALPPARLARGVLSVAFSPDSRTLAAAGDEVVVHSYAIPGGKETQLRGHADRVTAVGFSSDGTLLSASDDASIILWARSRDEHVALKGHKGAVFTVAATAPNLIASGGDDNAVRFWDARTRSLLKTIGSQADEVDAIAFSPSGDLLVSTEGNGTVELFEVNTDHPKARVNSVLGEGARSPLSVGASVENVAFAGDASFLVSSDDDGFVRLWDARKGEQIATLGRHDGHVVGLDLSKDDTLVASGDERGVLRVFDVKTRNLVHEVATDAGATLSVSLSSDGRELAFGSIEGFAGIWRITSDRVVKWKAHDASTNSIRFLGSGAVVTASSDKSLRSWDAGTQRLLRTFLGHSAEVMSLAVSSNGSLIASASRDRTVRIWDSASGQELRKLTGHSDVVFDVRFAPDDLQLASASKDGTVRLWNKETGQAIRILRGHAGAVYAIDYSTGGSLLASGGGDDRTLRLWDTSTGDEIGSVASEDVLAPGERMVAAIEGRTGLKIADLDISHSEPACR